MTARRRGAELADRFRQLSPDRAEPPAPPAAAPDHPAEPSPTATQPPASSPQVRKSASPPIRQTRTAPVRVTVPLTPVEHQRLRAWSVEAAAELGLTEVAAAEVLRVLLGLVLADPEVSARVRAELHRSGGNRRR